jgi:hypothetical protein
VGHHAGLIDQAGRGMHGGPGHLVAHQHVGADVLDGLKAADGLAELMTFLGVGDGQIERRPGVAHLQRGGEQCALAPETHAQVEQGLPGRQRVQMPQWGEGTEWRGHPLPVGRRRGGSNESRRRVASGTGHHEQGI